MSVKLLLLTTFSWAYFPPHLISFVDAIFWFAAGNFPLDFPWKFSSGGGGDGEWWLVKGGPQSINNHHLHGWCPHALSQPRQQQQHLVSFIISSSDDSSLLRYLKKTSKTHSEKKVFRLQFCVQSNCAWMVQQQKMAVSFNHHDKTRSVFHHLNCHEL